MIFKTRFSWPIKNRRILNNKNQTSKMRQTNSKNDVVPKAKNKGAGAGGSNTNLYGKAFEEKTSNESRLLKDGYFIESLSIGKTTKKFAYFLYKQFEDKKIVFLLQNGLKTYMKQQYDIDVFRCPDEAYVIEYENGENKIIVLEKKAQYVDGSVETKLWSGPSLKREYEILLNPIFKVEYAFCVSDFLKKKYTSKDKKYVILNKILGESNIEMLFGDDANYFETLDLLIKNSL